jgi:hypothetical protein
VVSNTEITCVTSAHAVGLVDVVVDNGPWGSATLPAVWTDTGTSSSSNQVVGNIQSGFLYEAIYINLALSTNDISYSVSPAAPENQGYTIATVGTNNPTGYDLSLVSSGSDLVCGSHNIQSLSSTGSLIANAWGYNAVPPSGSWTAGVPDTPTAWKPIPVGLGESLHSSGSATAGEDTGIYFGTKVNSTQAACNSYARTLTVTALAATP